MKIDIQDIVGSHKFKAALYTLGTVLVLLFLFQLGMFIGFKRAAFSNRIGENYFRQIKGGDGFMMGIRRDDLATPHGAIGQIIEIKLPKIVVMDRDGVPKTINIASATPIRGANGATNLKINDLVIIFGSNINDSDVIEASLVRILPKPEQVNK